MALIGLLATSQHAVQIPPLSHAASAERGSKHGNYVTPQCKRDIDLRAPLQNREGQY